MSVKLNSNFFLIVHDANNVVILEKIMSSSTVFSGGVRATRSLVLYVCLVDGCLSFCTFSFDHCVVDIRILITPLVSSSSSYE